MLTTIYTNMSSPTENSLCHYQLGKYLQEFHFGVDRSTIGGQRATKILENPNLALRMIRRILVLLINDTSAACRDSAPDVEQTISKVVGNSLKPPTQQDLDDALLGLLRIHYIYGLNATNEIRLGIFNGVKTEAELSSEDCLALANKAMDINAEVLAYQWLMSAYHSDVDLGVSQTPRDNQTCENDDFKCTIPAPRRALELQNTLTRLLNLTEVESLEELHKKLRDKRQERLKDFFEYSKYAVCRGENNFPVDEQDKRFCYYKTTSNSYFYINPIKTEVLSMDPLILQYYEFVGDQTIDFMFKKASKRMTRSGVLSIEKPETEFHDYRTSVNGWLYDTEDHNPHKILVTLNKRIEKLTGLEVHKKGASYAQVVSYGSLGGHYDFHFDSIQSSKYNVFENGGDRIATLLMILSDLKMGGYTGFPELGVFAKPIKGSAILWYNLWRNGEKDFRMQHGGCPVVLGNKKVANRWILQHENMWKHPCLLDSSV